RCSVGSSHLVVLEQPHDGRIVLRGLDRARRTDRFGIGFAPDIRATARTGELGFAARAPLLAGAIRGNGRFPSPLVEPDRRSPESASPRLVSARRGRRI